MLARTAAILLLALAACSVKLEGAACTGDDNCPGGQKCGFDGKCSNAAAACAEPICRPGTHGCGSDGTIVPCEAALDGICATFKASDGEDCGAGLTCGPSVTCVDMYAVTLDAPAANTLVGPSGVAVQATVTLGSAAVVVPSTIKLLEGTAAKADLALTTQTGLQAHYQGSYVPGSTADGSVALAAVAAYGTADATPSPTVTVVVDQTAPAITAPTLTCDATPCRRDSKLTVSANVTDARLASVVAQVAFPAPVGPVPVALTAAASSYSGTLDLKNLQFPFFSLPNVQASFAATDQVGNASQAATTSLPVTRLRWATAVESTSPPSVTGAALDASGKAYVGGSNGKVYVLTATGTVSTSWSVGSGAITAAPSLGQSDVSSAWVASLWVPSQNGAVYVVRASDGSVLNGSGAGCSTGGAVAATPALQAPNYDWGFVGASVGGATPRGYVYAVASLINACRPSDSFPLEAFSAAVVVDGGPAKVYAASDAGRLRSLAFDGTFFTPNWGGLGYADVGPSVRVPLAINGGTIWSASYETTGQIFSTTSAGTPTQFATGGTLTDPIILANGDIVVGDGNVLRRWTAAGTVVWASPNLGASVVSAMAIASGDASFLVPTADGKVHALKADGSVLWEGALTVGAALREGNVFKLGVDSFSTAVIGAADGKVYAVLVDGQLDASAPWPKVHHDTRNTGNASAPP